MGHRQAPLRVFVRGKRGGRAPLGDAPRRSSDGAEVEAGRSGLPHVDVRAPRDAPPPVRDGRERAHARRLQGCWVSWLVDALDPRCCLTSYRGVRGTRLRAWLIGHVGKTMIAKNLAHEAILAGRTVRFTSASAMLQDLAAQDGARALQRAIRRYSSPTLLVVDELGYLSYDHRHADLLFEVVNRRYEAERSILVTTNKPFAEWGEVFPSATCVVTLVDRLVHRSEIIGIDADSFRLREAEERHQRKSR
jgi:hypothetical protein